MLDPTIFHDAYLKCQVAGPKPALAKENPERPPDCSAVADRLTESAHAHYLRASSLAQPAAAGRPGRRRRGTAAHRRLRPIPRIARPPPRPGYLRGAVPMRP